MFDPRTNDLAVDFALDLVDPIQRELVLQRIQNDPDAWDELAELENVVADLTLLAPQSVPDPSLCQSIVERLEREEEIAAVEIVPCRPSRVFAFSGWAVAACLALSAAFLVFQNRYYQDQILKLGASDSSAKALTASDQHKDATGAQSVVIDVHDPEGSQALSDQGTGSNIKPLRAGADFKAVETNVYRLEQDIDALQQRVSELRRVREERFQAIPGLSRLTIVEMRGEQQTTEPQVEEANAAESEIQIAPEPVEKDPDDPVIAAADWSSLFHRALGVHPFAGIVDHSASLSDTNTGDGKLLLAGASNGQGNSASVINLDNAVGYVPAGPFAASQSVPLDGGVTDNETDVVESLPVASESDSVADPPMSAYTIYDETTGQGSILVNNLPDPDGGERYHLWMVDQLEDQPVNVGALPVLETGGGRVFFELGEAGYSPSEFFITQEPEIGTDVPTGDPLLFGPDFSGQTDAEPPVQLDRGQP